jgi:hypothetical protein
LGGSVYSIFAGTTESTLGDNTGADIYNEIKTDV